MTVKYIVDKSVAKKKLEAGGNIASNVSDIQADLYKKTVRDDSLVAGVQTAGTAQALPGTKSIKPTVAATGVLGSADSPMHVVMDDSNEGGLLGGAKKGMASFGLAGAMIGGMSGLMKKTLGNLKQRRLDKRMIPEVPIGRQGIKLQMGGPAWIPKPKSLNLGLKSPLPGIQSPTNLGGVASKAGAGAGAGMIGGAIGGVADLAGDMVQSFAKPGQTNSWGITEQNYKANTATSALKDAGKWATTGATFGAAAGPVGALIGGLAGGIFGGISGLLKGKKKAPKDKKEYLDSTQAAYEGYNQKANAAQYAALAKCGAKLHITKKLSATKKDKISYKGRKFKPGGKLNSVGEVNVIPAGTLHKENNNLGNKDKGLPIIDEDGKKVFEVEREELILRLKTTKEVESLVDKYKKSNNSRHLVDLGKLLSKEIMTNTHDYSGKFGMEVK